MGVRRGASIYGVESGLESGSPTASKQSGNHHFRSETVLSFTFAGIDDDTMFTASYVFLKDVHDVKIGFDVMTSSLHDGMHNMAGPTTSTTNNVCTWNCPLGLDKLR